MLLTVAVGAGCPGNEAVGDVEGVSGRKGEVPLEANDQHSHQGVLLETCLTHQVENQTREGGWGYKSWQTIVLQSSMFKTGRNFQKVKYVTSKYWPCMLGTQGHNRD